MLRLVRRFHLTDNPRADILSGLTVALALVPEAIAFAFVAKVDPLVGGHHRGGSKWRKTTSKS